VFREVHRVLRDDGTLWLNLGDSYTDRSEPPKGGRKPKDLVGIPWEVAFALRADTWYLRAENIWAKSSGMPESVHDRPTRNHEHVFLLAKRASYFYDAEAIREPHTSRYTLDALAKADGNTERPTGNNFNKALRYAEGTRTPLSRAERGALVNPAGRNRRSVWNINPEPASFAHFATMPTELASVCIRAGTSQRGRCAHCGAPWQRVVERQPLDSQPHVSDQRKPLHSNRHSRHRSTVPGGQSLVGYASHTVGWRPGCDCPLHEPVPCVVLDPFGGAGTTAVVCERLGRASVSIELSAQYATLAQRRLDNRGRAEIAESPAADWFTELCQ
jgi:DNA modification methylase